MASFGSRMRSRLTRLHQLGQDVPRIMAEVAEGATIAAVEKATNMTPPNGTSIAGTNTRSGELAQHWATDSRTTPTQTGGSVKTLLANDLQYASYVNDGHVMDEHFVPGLEINGGVLEMNTEGEGGIMVGTQTKYVQGLYMKQAAIGKYRSVVEKELDKRIREAFQR